MNPGLFALVSADVWSRGVLIIAAHPDDETIGAGGVIPGLPKLAIVMMTDGAPENRRWWGDRALPSREEYARARKAELAGALAVAGVREEYVRALGRQDQRAAFDLVGLAEDIVGLIHEFRPGVILTHPYEGGHPDHDAAAFAVKAAQKLVASEPPAIVEFTSYHATAEGVAVGRFLDAGLNPVHVGNATEVAIPLTSRDQERKRKMMQCFVTQTKSLKQFPIADFERYRLAPEYDFLQPPHLGLLNFERFDWKITGEEWRALAAEALRVLRIG